MRIQTRLLECYKSRLEPQGYPALVINIKGVLQGSAPTDIHTTILLCH